ncbi:MAG: alpha/beta hydrolase [Gemmataceae bacterium]
MNRLVVFVNVLTVSMLAGPLLAEEPVKKTATARGEKMLDEYLRIQTRQIADACLAGIDSKEQWEKMRPELRRQFLEMMGLWPLPERGDLKPVITGQVEADKHIIEKIHFQSLPGLYVTGNLYLPKNVTKPCPTILYVCGHGNTVVGGVSYGSKVNYQHHPAWFAENGYVCLILDTLQLGEIQGTHHGTHNRGMWWWQTRGYTPAGIECWNAMRALDYLETRKEVDAQRFGVTGRSGGGATSWWVSAADDRIQCMVPVAGIADLWAHVVQGEAARFNRGVINGHCDCMYMVNTYRWDFPLVVALCAPRPLLLGNSDADAIFPVPGYRRIADKVRKIYDLYGAGDKFALLETKGPHVDTPELRKGAFEWFQRWLKNDTNPITEGESKRLDPAQLKVFDRLPEDQLNTTIHEHLIQPKKTDLPADAETARKWWPGQKQEWQQFLTEKVFRGWPTEAPALDIRPAGDIQHNGIRLQAWDFTSEEGIELRVWLMTAAKTDKPTLVVLNAVDEAGWDEFRSDLGPAFGKLLLTDREAKLDETRFQQNQRVLEKFKWGFAYVAPRGIGPTRWAEPGSAIDTHIRRRFALLGQTVDGQRVWDVRRALAVLRGQPDLKEVPLWLQGKQDMAGIVLYATIFEPDVARLDLWHPAASHRQGPIFLNVAKELDMPQAMALAFPVPIRLYVQDDAEAKAWEWPLQLQQLLGQEHLKIRQVGK